MQEQKKIVVPLRKILTRQITSQLHPQFRHDFAVTDEKYACLLMLNHLFPVV